MFMNFKTWSDGPKGIVSEADPDKFGENLRLSGEAQSGRAVEIVGEFAGSGKSGGPCGVHHE